jgi:type III secretion system (T3SS) SseB-like protein
VRFRKPKPPEGLDLLDREFILATVEHGLVAPTGQTLEHDLPTSVRSLDDDDRHVLPLFTSEFGLREIYPQGSAWVSVPFGDVLRLLVGGDWDVAVIDPGSTDPREVPRANAKALLEHVAGN